MNIKSKLTSKLTSKLLIYALSFLLAFPAFAADNTVVLTPGSGVTMRTKDVGTGIQSPFNILGDLTGTAIYGTAGSANSNVITVQGIASGTPQPVSIASGGVTSGAYASGSFASGALASGSIASGAMVDLLTFQGTKAAGTAAANSLLTGAIYNSSPITLSTGQQAALQSDINGYLKVTAATLDPCQSVAKTSLAFSQAASAQIIAGTSSKKTYICSITLIAPDAEKISLVAGTGSVCATGISAIIGATAAISGMSLAANGGFSLGSGIATVANGSVNADNICLLQSGSGLNAGVLTYVQN